MTSYSQEEDLVPDSFVADTRPGADAFVYCKGCGEQLAGQPRRAPRKTVAVMMCESCQEVHGHPLIPTTGSQTYCYRCGTPDEIFHSSEQGNPVYHVCPRCLPDRVARYRRGDFTTPGSTTAWGRHPVRRKSESTT